MTDARVDDETAGIAELDGVGKGIGGEIAVDEGRTCSQTLNGKPYFEVFWAIWTVQGHDFSGLDIEVFKPPVTHWLEFLEELLVRPLLFFEFEKEVVTFFCLCSILEDVVN